MVSRQEKNPISNKGWNNHLVLCTFLESYLTRKARFYPPGERQNDNWRNKDGSRKDCDSLQRQRRQTIECMQGSGVLMIIFSFVLDLDDSLLYQVCKKISVCALLPLFYTDQCYPPAYIARRRSLSILHC
jgi:hypothetical protein